MEYQTTKLFREKKVLEENNNQGWRLPTVKEWNEIGFKKDRRSLAIDPTRFYWTSDVVSGDSAYIGSQNNVLVSSMYKFNDVYYIRNLTAEESISFSPSPFIVKLNGTWCQLAQKPLSFQATWKEANNEASNDEDYSLVSFNQTPAPYDIQATYFKQGTGFSRIKYNKPGAIICRKAIIGEGHSVTLDWSKNMKTNTFLLTVTSIDLRTYLTYETKQDAQKDGWEV